MKSGWQTRVGIPDGGKIGAAAAGAHIAPRLIRRHPDMDHGKDSCVILTHGRVSVSRLSALLPPASA